MRNRRRWGKPSPVRGGSSFATSERTYRRCCDWRRHGGAPLSSLYVQCKRRANSFLACGNCLCTFACVTALRGNSTNTPRLCTRAFFNRRHRNCSKRFPAAENSGAKCRAGVECRAASSFACFDAGLSLADFANSTFGTLIAFPLHRSETTFPSQERNSHDRIHRRAFTRH